MKKISDVHGTFNSFKEVAAAMGMKAPKVKAETRKCKNCGGPLRHVEGTNVWVCDFFKLEDQKLSEDVEVQVFTKCGNKVIV